MSYQNAFLFSLVIRLAVNRMDNGIPGVFWKVRNQIENFLGRKMAHHILKHFEGYPRWTGLLAIAAEHAGIPDLIGPY